MTLIDNWQHIAAKAWSSRLAWLATFLSALEVALPVIQALIPESKVPQGVFAGLALFVSAAAGVARLVQQPKLVASLADIEAAK
jgi:hypothetical protein